MSTLYATFQRAADAEKAAGALIDHGASRSDLTITSKQASRTRSRHTSADETAVQAGENEGWAPRTLPALASAQQLQDREDIRADQGYREADQAERSAKRGISFTTINDALAGAVMGGFVGACCGIVICLVSMSPKEWSMLMAPALTLAVVVALAAGIIIGAVVGMLKDLGFFGKGAASSTRQATGHPVLLAVDVSSGRTLEGDARRLVTKYHAASIDMS